MKSLPISGVINFLNQERSRGLDFRPLRPTTASLPAVLGLVVVAVAALVTDWDGRPRGATVLALDDLRSDQLPRAVPGPI